MWKILTHKAIITTAADDKICDIFLIINKNKVWYYMRIVCQQTTLMKYHAIFVIEKKSKIWNCRLLQIIGGALRVKTIEAKIYLFNDWSKEKMPIKKDKRSMLTFDLSTKVVHIERLSLYSHIFYWELSGQIKVNFIWSIYWMAQPPWCSG